MRTTKNISITLPIAMLKSAKRLAKRENRTISELVREAFRRYEVRAKEAEENLKMVERIIAEVKKNPPTQAEILAEEKRLRRIERRYERPDLTDEDIVRIIHRRRGVPDA